MLFVGVVLRIRKVIYESSVEFDDRYTTAPM